MIKRKSFYFSKKNYLLCIKAISNGGRMIKNVWNNDIPVEKSAYIRDNKISF